ncbi:MAG: DUF885 domain-containing protein [Steroidobacteraceae bacterium]
MAKNRGTLISILLVSIIAATGCARKTDTGSVAAKPRESAEWEQFSHDFIEGYFRHNPAFAVYQGRHEYDGQAADWTNAGLAAQIAFLKENLTRANAFRADSLSPEQRFERDYLGHVARKQLFWLEDADAPHSNVSWYFDAGLDPNVYIARPYADPATRMRAFIKYARAIPTVLAQIKANLRTPMPLSFVDYAEPGFRGFASYYTGDAKAAFATVQDPALQSEFDMAAKEASTAMTAMADWVAAQRKTATQDFALGGERFLRMLRETEAVDTTLDELERIGRADLARNQEALGDACAKFAPGATLGACMQKMNDNKGAGGPVAEARRQLPGLRQFLVDHQIVSIPGTEEALVEESPPYNRQNSAYIDIPGPYEKGLPSVYYISPPDPTWSPAEREAYVPGRKDLLFTSVHEVWPGHFLNFLHANRAKSIFGKVFVGYAFAEGWAHYTEEMMWDAGLDNGDPETHIGQLSNALLRNCRFLSAIGLHARGMSASESLQMFREECYQDEGNARQQAARGTYDPAYLNYTMGKLLIRKLRDDWTGGDRSRLKEFHDQFLGYGGPPIPLVRAAMMHEEQPRAVF